MADNKSATMTEVEEIKNRATATLARHISLYGLNRSESRLFSLMFLENEPMTLDDMSQQLGMSKTTMSTGIRSLEDAKMVEQTWQRGIRKDLYKAEENLYNTFSSEYLGSWFSIIKNNKKIFKEILRDIDLIVDKIDDDNLKNSLLNYSNKINNVLDFYSWLKEVLVEMKERIENLNG